MIWRALLVNQKDGNLAQTANITSLEGVTSHRRDDILYR